MALVSSSSRMGARAGTAANPALVAARRLGSGFAAFTLGQKIVVIAAVLGLAVGGWLFSTWASTPTYAPMFSNLDAKDASAIVDKLTSAGVKYELADGGSTILVPSDKVYELRLSMSGAGLPSSSDSGYALLDKQGVTTSDFQQQVTYQRAMEGELAKTIGSLDGVTSAVVHLAIPQKDVFLDDSTTKPTASVLVATAPGSKLSAGQVRAIVHLVSASVEGLDAGAVTVVDADGRLLSSPEEGDDAAAAGTRSQATASYDATATAALQKILDTVVGPGNAVAKVTAELNFDATDTTTEKFIADPSVPPLAQTTTKEVYTGSGAGSGGVLGPDNIQVPTGTGTSGNGSYTKESTTVNNSVGKVTQKSVAAPGSVKRMSVAVVVDSKAAGSANVASLTQLVTSAAGVDTTRGDTVAVTQMPFDTTKAAQAKAELAQAKAAQSRQTMLSYAKTAGLALLVLGMLAAAAIGLRRRRKAQVEVLDVTRLDGLDGEGAAAAIAAGTQDSLAIGSGDAALATSALGAPPALEAGAAHRRDEVVALVERQPEEVAELLRGWLADRRS